MDPVLIAEPAGDRPSQEAPMPAPRAARRCCTWVISSAVGRAAGDDRFQEQVLFGLDQLSMNTECAVRTTRGSGSATMAWSLCS
jgi:hypothetical protein